MRIKKYHDWLIEQLKNHEEAVAYLNAALEEFAKGSEKSKEVLLMVLRNVVEAHGGMAKIAKKARLDRESLYKTLSNGNPELSTLIAVVCSLGLKLCFA